LVSEPEAFVVADGIQPGYGGLGAQLLAERASTPAHVRDGQAMSHTIATVHAELLSDDYFPRYWDVTPDRLRLPGATVAGCRVDPADQGAPVLLFNVGDASAYLVKDGYLARQSISDRSESGMLTQAVGGGPPGDPVPHTVSLDHLEPHNRVLLCSDGLTDTLTHAAIESVLRSSSTPGRLVVELLASAAQSTPTDDVTAVIIDVTWSGQRAETRLPRWFRGK
jgi:protein phosphatase